MKQKHLKRDHKKCYLIKSVSRPKFLNCSPTHLHFGKNLEKNTTLVWLYNAFLESLQSTNPFHAHYLLLWDIFSRPLLHCPWHLLLGLIKYGKCASVSLFLTMQTIKFVSQSQGNPSLSVSWCIYFYESSSVGLYRQLFSHYWDEWSDKNDYLPKILRQYWSCYTENIYITSMSVAIGTVPGSCTEGSLM